MTEDQLREIEEWHSQWRDAVESFPDLDSPQADGNDLQKFLCYGEEMLAEIRRLRAELDDNFGGK